jgi:hypothetical protein
MEKTVCVKTAEANVIEVGFSRCGCCFKPSLEHFAQRLPSLAISHKTWPPLQNDLQRFLPAILRWLIFWLALLSLQWEKKKLSHPRTGHGRLKPFRPALACLVRVGTQENRP